MIKPLEELKIDIEKNIRERQEPMKRLTEAYSTALAEEQQNNVTNLTNINEAIAIKSGYGKGEQ
ncbi:hypothetical protein [Lysinibacillus capsici]|uniref:hypothetical protein n=1 Tax=Lysinibacillus capsici TaxID=2115968 RepID=UPI0034E2DC40